MPSLLRATVVLFGLAAGAGLCQPAEVLPGTGKLQEQGDLSARMVAGIDRFLTAQTATAQKRRERFWHRDLSSPEAYESSVATNRERLRLIIGAVDKRVAPGLIQPARAADSTAVATTNRIFVEPVSWPVLPGVSAEGLWLKPAGPAAAWVIAIPDAGQVPEDVVGVASRLEPERQFARRLAENGCEVLIPVLVNRDDTFSGNARIERFTNQPHREWIYRQAYPLGRHIVGYEVQKVLAAVDYFCAQGRTGKIGVVGYGEGGLIGLYAAAVDTRINAALVSGYFESRQELWREPIYRNLFGLLDQFGDAELATLVAPRRLVIEHSPIQRVDGPPVARGGRSGAAPGRLTTADYELVELELQRARTFLGNRPTLDRMTLIAGTEGRTTGPGSDRALIAFLSAFGRDDKELQLSASLDLTNQVDTTARQSRQVAELQAFTQQLLTGAESNRAAFFWNNTTGSSPAGWANTSRELRAKLSEELIGRFDVPLLAPNPRSRLIGERANWTEYELTLDVYPDVFAWGYLLVPKGIQAGERRPVVVCQHGLEGLPADVVNEQEGTEAYKYYKGFAARLAGEGFVVFAPHNPYRGGDSFRVLQRKANPLGKSLFSIIVAQHEQILNWLGTQPFADPKRIGFYGLSYGGKTAMRVPAILEGYCLSICSGDFNDWIRKNVSVEFPASYMFTGEYEMPEWNLGNTFNYAEMAALIAPRPFMVERGHQDPVGLDDWIESEFRKVKRFYTGLGLPGRAEIEFFDGPHTINAKASFEFLRTHLQLPPR